MRHYPYGTSSNVTRTAFSAACRCGWVSRPWPSRARAEQELDDHLTAMAQDPKEAEAD
jgi:hypothetical protein